MTGRVSSLCRVFVFGMACSSGCAGSLPPPPPRLQAPGITTEIAAFRPQTIASLGFTPLTSRIMQIARDEQTGDLLVVAEKGIRWIGANGAVQRDLLFPVRLFRSRLVTLPDGRQAIAGFTSPDQAVLLDLEGRELKRFKVDRYSRPEFQNVAGGAAIEVIAPGRLDARIMTLDGTVVGKVSSPAYATIKTVVQADHDPEYEIVFVNTSLKKGPITVRIMNADGSTVSRWSERDGGWLSFVPALGDTLLWGITAEGFTAWNAAGTRVSAFPAEDVHYLRDIVGTRFKGHTVLVASGGGYSNLSVLCVFDDARRLVFQEVFSSRTYAVFAEPEADYFYVGIDDNVVRYTAGGWAACIIRACFLSRSAA